MIMTTQTAPTQGITKKTAANIPATGDPTTALDRYLLDSRETGGAIAVVEYNLAPRVLAAPVHRHSREDQYSLVLEGRLGVFQDGDEVVADVGELVLKPRGRWHTFWNAGDQPLRVLELNVPGGLEELFRSLAALGDGYDPETLPAMAGQYGCDVDFERTMPLVEQHGLIF
jgi:mannose-6-phosphate isomerase-like protein (cupin superfamily)